MQLTEIQIAGFKSFAKPTRLTFGPGLTVVIGPNGAGKSNLAEAIRWVLGEQSIKQLRGQGSQDVIFAGSSIRPRSRKASVLLTFDNESGRFPYKAGEVTIGRVLTGAGESEYSLNGDPIRLVELQQMLAEAGIGARSYTVISQGMVDRYLTANPEGRKELFDEATGIRSLQIKIARSEQKLNKMKQHALELAVVLQELAPRLRVLTRQVKRHEERQQLEQTYQEAQARWFEGQWHHRQQTVLQHKQRIAVAEQRIAAARREREQIEEKILAAVRQTGVETNYLAQELRQAKEAFEWSRVEYERVTKERTMLTASWRDIREARRRAEAILAARRKKSAQSSWITSVKNLLSRCQGMLSDLTSGRTVEQHDAVNLRRKVIQMLESLSDETPLAGARSLLEQLEQPLQEVARLEAIEEERLRQLGSLPEVKKPSDREVRRLMAALGRQEKEETGQETADIEKELAGAREAEVEAERIGSATLVAVQQAANELESLEQEIRRERGSVFLDQVKSKTPVKDKTMPSGEELRQMATHMAALGETDPLVLKEHQEVAARYKHLRRQLEDIHQTEVKIQRLMSKLRSEMQERFTVQFSVIKQAFAQYFSELFGGGRARLEVLEEGIGIFATPPGKRPRHINLLSGGERALTSLALLLAIIQAQQPPFMVLDEVDAALDEANSARFAAALNTKSQGTQCIVISHNRETFAQAGVLYGVTMERDGISKVYAVRLADIENTKENEKVGEKMKV